MTDMPVMATKDIIQAQSILRCLRFLMQKDQMAQDVFLIGAPGKLRRAIVMMFLELANREYEYVCLSRDTVEGDLKQRREIVAHSANLVDQAAVRAAIAGRVLVLDGVEKAERNVLPVLNNLLENREVQLDDGRFLMAAQRYDKLLAETSEQTLDKLKLVRVHEQFRVIALGLPVPRYRGNLLDPPFRSRFQAYCFNALTFEEGKSLLRSRYPSLSDEQLHQVLSIAHALHSDELHQQVSGGQLLHFPLENVDLLCALLAASDQAALQPLLDNVYPAATLLADDARSLLAQVVTKFAPSVPHSPPSPQSPDVASPAFVATPDQQQLLQRMSLLHAVADFCLVGPKGSGKTALVREFAARQGYGAAEVETVVLYEDLVSRDLLQRRCTLPNGDTVWRFSPLVEAALRGHLVVLDGLHRVHSSTLSTLSRLIHDREVQLFDGTRLLRSDRYEHLMETHALSEDELTKRKVLRINPRFRIVAVAEPPTSAAESSVSGKAEIKQWMTAEIVAMFLWLPVPPLSIDSQRIVVKHRLEEHLGAGERREAVWKEVQRLTELVEHSRSSADTNDRHVGRLLSTRQLLRLADQMAQTAADARQSLDGLLGQLVNGVCLSRFMPPLPRERLQALLANFKLQPAPAAAVDAPDAANALPAAVDEVELRAKVPDILFYDIAGHLNILRQLQRDFQLGQHLLLIGNQGVGKNKLVDKLLQRLGRAREYIQLHRDSTVQSLTLQPTVDAGVVRYDDSPLVNAVKRGLVLVVDEADKAPTHVTCVLKALLEQGEMHLADGRKIVSGGGSAAVASESTVVMHKDFRMIVLANRPGFPFLGNDFYAVLGDMFAVHAIDNPDPASELALLTQFGPGVPAATLRQLVAAFADLRRLADDGLLAYPYSTRELVNIVKHLQRFPADSVATAVRNVLDFDMFERDRLMQVHQVLQRHGVPVTARATDVSLGRELVNLFINLSDLFRYELFMELYDIMKHCV